MSSNSIILKQVQAIHSPNGREIHIKPLITHLEDMLKHTNLTPNAAEDPSFAASCDSDSLPVLHDLEPYIDQIANKLGRKYSIGRDDHSITMEILSTISSFDWHGKLLIVLEVVMMHYAEYLFIAQSSNPLAKYLAVLTHKPAVLELRVLKPQAESIEKILKSLLDIVKCIVELKELPVARDFRALATAMEYIPVAVYYAILYTVILSCFISFPKRTKKQLVDMESEREEVTRNVDKVRGYLHDKLNICYQHVSKKQYRKLLRVFKVAHTDNMEVLKALLDLKADPQPLVDGATKKMIREGKYVCLYGGEDIEWIRKFTSTAQVVAHTAGIQLEMVYVGRSNTEGRVKSNISTIELENLSHCLQGMSWFWLWLKSMWHSKNRLGHTLENDRIMQEIRALLSYEHNGDGWAIISGKFMEMVRAEGNTFLICLLDYNAWKADAEQTGFLMALRNHLAKLHTQHHWSRLVL